MTKMLGTAKTALSHDACFGIDEVLQSFQEIDKKIEEFVRQKKSHRLFKKAPFKVPPAKSPQT